MTVFVVDGVGDADARRELDRRRVALRLGGAVDAGEDEPALQRLAGEQLPVLVTSASSGFVTFWSNATVCRLSTSRRPSSCSSRRP